MVWAARFPRRLLWGDVPVIVEVDQAALARMLPEQRAAYLKMLDTERRKRIAQGPVKPTQAQINALAAASAARAGSQSVD